MNNWQDGIKKTFDDLAYENLMEKKLNVQAHLDILDKILI